MKTTNHLTYYWQTLVALWKEDFASFKGLYWGKVLDNTIVVIANVVIMGSIMQRFGLSTELGPMMLCSLISSSMLFNTYGNIAGMVSDITGPKTISHYLIMPLPTALVFFKIIGTWAWQGLLIGITAIPMGKLLMWHRFTLSNISVFKLIAISIVSSIYFGAFGLWTVSMIKHRGALSSIWTRFIFPLWIFGGFQFSWYAMRATYPQAAHIGLLNPVLYTTEGFRDAILGGPYISAWACCLALMGFTVIFGWWGIKRLKTRLDFV